MIALLEGLTTANAETMEIQPGVAKTWDISDDGLTYNFHFATEARWSTGDTVTANDFQFSL